LDAVREFADRLTCHKDLHKDTPTQTLALRIANVNRENMSSDTEGPPSSSIPVQRSGLPAHHLDLRAFSSCMLAIFSFTTSSHRPCLSCTTQVETAGQLQDSIRKRTPVCSASVINISQPYRILDSYIPLLQPFPLSPAHASLSFDNCEKTAVNSSSIVYRDPRFS